jgi:hypothetical protein
LAGDSILTADGGDPVDSIQDIVTDSTMDTGVGSITDTEEVLQQGYMPDAVPLTTTFTVIVPIME